MKIIDEFLNKVFSKRRNMKLNTFIADDNIYYLERLERIADSIDKIKLVGRARDGKEALTQIRKEKPELLIIDVEMPKMNGLELIKKLDYNPYIILCTGSFYHFDEIQDVDCLLKPVLKEEIEEKIEKIYNLYREKAIN
ncbi:MAG: response regulator [Candidatus Mcinerneyibacterium aminivorans]|uniref:Response regulator n=1 Tax=Candidatus Mcinerneyibacterium aminivorans TaxID=2703815 RepID=A0A5D0M9Q8_9BACT|nr:MAG: response regulator [Candidatus Mcinerneyibacterium aminivorans]